MSEISTCDRFALTLMDLCHERNLCNVRLQDVIVASGLSRQTFYNHFDNLDDLVDYAVSRPLFAGKASPLSASILASYKYVATYPDFFIQVVRSTSCSGLSDAICDWLDKRACIEFIVPSLPEDEKIRRMVSITLFNAGCSRIAFQWVDGGMRIPVNLIVGTICSMIPGFMLGTRKPLGKGSLDYPHRKRRASDKPLGAIDLRACSGS